MKKRNLLLAAIIAMGIKPALAQYDSLTYSLHEVTISANKFEEQKRNVAQHIENISAKDVIASNPQNTADMLQNSGLVTVQKSQQGGGSPMMRGFEANRILLVIDGVRMNNAIYRGGHLQNVITMDATMLAKTDILFGPSSTIYGSDALGGVLHFYTKNPLLNSTATKKVIVAGNAMVRYSTANNENTGHFDFNVGGKKVASLTAITFSKFDDLRKGYQNNPAYGGFGDRINYSVRNYNQTKDTTLKNANPDIQKSSGYSQFDILEKILFQQNEKINHVLNIQLSNTTDIPRYDRLTDVSGTNLKWAEWYYGPQMRNMIAYEFNAKKMFVLANEVKAGLNYQMIEESRNQRRYNSANFDKRIENVGVVGWHIDILKRLGQTNEIRYGIESQMNNIQSTATRTNILTGAESKLDTRYPDGGSTMNYNALYITHTSKLNKQFVLNDGLRLNYIMLHATFNDTSILHFPFTDASQKNSVITSNLGVVYLPTDNWKISWMGSTGFRAPNVDDLSKVNESAKGAVIVPNTNLKPEHTYNVDLGITKICNKNVKLEVVGFYTFMKNLITIDKTTFNGQKQIMYNGTLSDVYSNTNAHQAYLYGFNTSVEAHLNNWLVARSTLNYTYGRKKTDSTPTPLDHVAPISGKTSLDLKGCKGKFNSSLYLLYNGWKKTKDYRLNAEDNESYATSFGMPAWMTLNIKASYQIHKSVMAQVGLENILDTHYRVFASGISGAGRNFVIALRATF
jgi:hemoglobin/transferrin/lactoferrin receptor protein